MAVPTLGDAIFYKFAGTEQLGVNFHTHYGPGPTTTIPDVTVPVSIPVSGTVCPGIITEIGTTFTIVVWTPLRAFFVRQVALGSGLGQFVLKI